MSDLAVLLLTAALVNNYVLVQFLGLCPFMGVSNRFDTAVPMSLATTFVLTLSAAVTHVVHNQLLVPLEIEYLRLIVFIAVIASCVQATEAFIKATSPLLHQLLGIYLPLITTNCAVLAVALVATETTSFADALLLAIGAALGFSLVLVLFAAQREKLADDAVPDALRGHPIALVTVGIASLAFYGFRGIGQ